MADDADTHEKDVEEIDERMQKLTHKLENARGLLGLERITLIVLRHRGKYAGCLSRPEYRLDAANAAKTPGV